MNKSWAEPQVIDKKIIEQFPELPPTVVQLLHNRNLTTQEEIDEFLSPDYSKDIHDPFLFNDMKKACQRIQKAIDKQEKIIIYGDYDADGVSSAVILTTVLNKLGAKVDAYLPHREKEGYGLNENAVKELAKSDVKLLITCDCGISNRDEVKIAKDNNLDVIVTDHHAIPEKLPDAVAIIHPQISGEKYPFKFLAGGGVAFKLAQGILRSSKLNEEEEEKTEKWLLDIVAIATVADMVPLLGENRTLVKYGLMVLRKTQRLGLQKMIDVASIDREKIDAVTIGFALAPRINAAGRMDHANLAYYLLTETEDDKALELAKTLNQSNLDRQRVTEATFREAKNQKVDLTDRLLVFYQPDWPAGLTGLVASKLSRQHNRPCLVLTKVEDNIVGSARSIKAFDVTAALVKNSDLLLRFGGHPQAAGFSLIEDNLEKFKLEMKKLANDTLTDDNMQAPLDIELAIDWSEINWSLVDILNKFEPYGQSNPEPNFLSRGILITQAKRVGKDLKHWKLELVKQDKKFGAIAFGLGKMDLAIGQRIDLVYNLNINQWNGSRSIQLKIKDIQQSFG
ncbi:single-stranded-DNA-specific exonuclease RecJ [bacterium]|jgi:single-stranded-DNA-specific exonuclease|nr:single-stranded-DNA-specific exonuclease RecJ [bacterium]MBT4648718.1 single-stranded-DNA-specific exonuclease RecJ [bacterium]